MSKIIYTFTFTTAMLAFSALGTPKPDGKSHGAEKQCELQCEQKKEKCEGLKADKVAFQKCVMDAEQQCKQACKQEPDDDQEKDEDPN